MGKKSPLSMACTVELVHRARLRDTIENALEQEYRFTSRAVEKADFLEGVRAQIIDKDRNPNWMHSSARDVPPAMVASLLLPLGPRALKLN
jgi:enoyl-CoA hydratase